MTVEHLLSDIYEEHWSHIDFIDNMNGGDCDCLIHATIGMICSYAGLIKVDS